MLTVVDGNLLDAKEDYIVHQCNCRTTKPYGLSKSIFQRFPGSDVYTNNTRKLGSIEFRDRIVAFYSQDTPGGPKGDGKDSKIGREVLFQKCLNILSRELEPTDTVAFPYGIGCGLAKGDWKTYEKMISNFAEEYDVVIYKL